MNYFKILKKLLINRKIFKNKFYEKGDFKNSEKKIFQDEVDQMNWVTSLREHDLNISKYENNEILYERVDVLEVTLKKKKNLKLIIDKIQKNIHHPLMLIIKYDEGICFSGALKNKNKVDKGKLVIEKLFITDWIDLNNLNKQEKAFLESLDINNYSYNDFYKFYLDYINRLVSFNICKENSSFEIQEKNDIKNNTLILDQIDYIEKEVVVLKGKIKKENQFNSKLSLNKEIKNKQNQIKDLKNKLK